MHIVPLEQGINECLVYRECYALDHQTPSTMFHYTCGKQNTCPSAYPRLPFNHQGTVNWDILAFSVKMWMFNYTPLNLYTGFTMYVSPSVDKSFVLR
jgi:hypothetical protein